MTTEVHSQPSPAILALVAKAAADAEYRQALIDDPETAVRGFALTDEEIRTVVNTSRDEREEMMEALGERASQLSVTFFQQVTTFFNFSCFLTY
jgi:hypothetical protein